MKPCVDEIVCHVSRRHYAIYLVGFLVMITGGILLVVFGLSLARADVGFVFAALGLLVTLVFGLASVRYLSEITSSEPRLIINDQGIVDRFLGGQLIPWSEILGFYMSHDSSSAAIFLKLRDPEMFASKRGFLGRVFRRFDRALGYEELGVSLVGLDVDSEEVSELLSRHVNSVNREQTYRPLPGVLARPGIALSLLSTWGHTVYWILSNLGASGWGSESSWLRWP